METFEYKKVDNCSIYADVYKAPQNNAPAIIYIHGGGLIWGSRKEIPVKQVEMYNNAGFTIISIDYRLAPETKLPSIIEDIQAAIHWVKSEGPKLFGIDADKIAVVGSSAGAYLSLMTGTFEEKPNTIVAFYGYGNLLGDWSLKPSEALLKKTCVTWEQASCFVGNKTISEGKIDRFLFYTYCRQRGNWIYQICGPNLMINKKKMNSYCPINNIGEGYPPTLLIHGDKDEDVPYEQSVEFNKELSNRGISSRLITIKDGAHAFDYEMSNPESVKTVEAVIEYLKETLKC